MLDGVTHDQGPFIVIGMVYGGGAGWLCGNELVGSGFCGGRVLWERVTVGAELLWEQSYCGSGLVPRTRAKPWPYSSIAWAGPFAGQARSHSVQLLQCSVPTVFSSYSVQFLQCSVPTVFSSYSARLPQCSVPTVLSCHRVQVPETQPSCSARGRWLRASASGALAACRWKSNANSAKRSPCTPRSCAAAASSTKRSSPTNPSRVA